MPAKNVLARGDHLRGDAACREPKESGKFTLMLMVAKRLEADAELLKALCVQVAFIDMLHDYMSLDARSS